MDMPRNRFKHAILSKSTPIGTWLVSGAPSTAEAMGCAGFDFLVLDMEHTPIDMDGLAGMLRTIEGTPAGVITRLPWNDMVMVKRALDAGAQSLMFPFVQNAEEAQARGRLHALSAGRRARRRGRPSREPLRQRARTTRRTPRPSCASSCRSRRSPRSSSCRRSPQVPGVDSLFIGPADLSASMGHLGNIDASRRAGEARAGRGGVPEGRQAGRHRRAESGDGREVRRDGLHLGRDRLGHRHDGRTRAVEWLGKVRGGLPADAGKPAAAY